MGWRGSQVGGGKIKISLTTKVFLSAILRQGNSFCHRLNHKKAKDIRIRGKLTKSDSIEPGVLAIVDQHNVNYEIGGHNASSTKLNCRT